MRVFLSLALAGAMVVAASLQPARAQSGCSDTSTGVLLGTLGGAALGGLLGSQIGGGSGKLVATGAGVFAGALLGNQVTKALTCQDQQYAYQTTQSSLEEAPTGETIAWNNPDSGHSGTVTPTRTYQDQGTYCREFQQTIVVGGKTEQGYGTACRQPDGSWKIVQ